MPPEKMRLVRKNFKDIKVNKIPLKKAISWHILPRPTIYLVEYKLNNIKRELIYKKERKKNKKETLVCDFPSRWSYLKEYSKGHNIHIKCTEKEYLELINNDIDFWKKIFFERQEEYQKIKWLRLGSQRKRFLSDCKLDITYLIVEQIRKQNKRFVTFASDIANCIILANGKNAVHSEEPNSLDIIDQFNNGYIDEIHSVRCLNESMNLENIEAAICQVIDSKTLSSIQRIGRSLRATLPEMYIVFVKDTKDQENILKLIKELDLPDSCFKYLKI